MEAERRYRLNDRLYQTILRRTRTIVFEYDPVDRASFVSPYVSEFLAGRFDGRTLSAVLLQDGVVSPEDVGSLENFRRAVLERPGDRELTLRLRCADGVFRWHKLSVSTYWDETLGRRLVAGTAVEVDAEIRLRESLRYEAMYDPVSGIYNQKTFFCRTEELLRARPDVPHCIIRFDIDRFKTINELYSISEGDRVLRHVGGILKRLMRVQESCGRLGNDVFALCVARTGAEATELAGQIEEKLNEYPIEFAFVISAGICEVERYVGQPANILCDRAALAQRTVKGNFVTPSALYHAELGAALNREHYIMGGMREALAQGQLVAYLQPKYDIEERTVFGAEALVRWNHPVEGLIAPDRFLPLFERNGFIIRLDEYMWDLVCGILRNWLDRGIAPVPVSVNVSRIHLHDPGFFRKLVALVEKHGIAPELLELEITESAYVDHPDSLYAVMEQLQDYGFRLLMDDFGSGYSSLNMLKDLPVDMLKIDLNFLKESRRGGQAGRTILEATIHMAQRLEMPVIVEGVETQEQVDLLLEAGCAHAQGYYFDRPMPVEEFERRILLRGVCRAGLVQKDRRGEPLLAAVEDYGEGCADAHPA